MFFRGVFSGRASYVCVYIYIYVMYMYTYIYISLSIYVYGVGQHLGTVDSCLSWLQEDLS